jgi:hypothetical protein
MVTRPPATDDIHAPHSGYKNNLLIGRIYINRNGQADVFEEKISQRPVVVCGTANSSRYHVLYVYLHAGLQS